LSVFPPFYLLVDCPKLRGDFGSAFAFFEFPWPCDLSSSQPPVTSSWGFSPLGAFFLKSFFFDRSDRGRCLLFKSA